MPGLKSGPISGAKATTERVYSVGVVVRAWFHDDKTVMNGETNIVYG
jgi:hypothetical protein